MGTLPCLQPDGLQPLLACLPLSSTVIYLISSSYTSFSCTVKIPIIFCSCSRQSVRRKDSLSYISSTSQYFKRRFGSASCEPSMASRYFDTSPKIPSIFNTDRSLCSHCFRQSLSWEDTVPGSQNALRKKAEAAISKTGAAGTTMELFRSIFCASSAPFAITFTTSLRFVNLLRQ